KAMGYEDCELVAQDWGGAIDWQFAYAYPNLITRLIVLNIPHPAKFAAGLRTFRQLKRSWYIAFFQLPAIPERMLKKNNYKAIRAVFRDSAINPNAFTEKDLDALVEAAAKPGALTGMLNYYRNLSIKTLKQKTEGKLTVPTLMIWGEEDAALGKELSEGTEDYVADLTLRYIPNCSHWVQQEQPVLVNQYIREFLT
ncbi:MAG: alpha/beta fold hydrolase, partial [Phormidesmis sp.]